MPRGDGTGPTGQGPNTGRGMGAGSSGGRGRMGGPSAAGPTGECVCPKCGAKTTHQRGVPCVEQKCPQCGAMMARA